MNKEIFEYIRRRKSGKTYKVGIIVGVDNNGVIKIGWSKCNLKSGDEFDLDCGMKMARERAINVECDVMTPDCIRKQVRRFGARAVRYFKGANTLLLPQ